MKQFSSCSKSKKRRMRKAEEAEERRLKKTKGKKGPPILVWRNPEFIDDNKNGESSNE